MVLRNCLGMIMSVSMFWMSSLAAIPFRRTNCLLGSVALADEEALLDEAVAPCCSLGAGRAASMDAISSVKTLGLGGGSSATLNFLTSVRVPVTAAAAAMAGDMRWVRPPAPCLPSKLRLEVDAHLSPGSSLSGFMARHMEQPGSLQSNPASIRILSRPSASAWAFTRPDPGTTMAYTWEATLRPLATAAAARTSSMRALVHEPMKTLSTLRPSRLVPGSRPMYSRLRFMVEPRAGSEASAGLGTLPVMGATSWGLVPQVTVGAMSSAFSTTSLS
mmetsp:Transcript_32816/g.72494  ORF Transcript_32816/g.72494 Transcript_32816/m.72494 type:complete len:275 (-) Transcript_32816:1039-1863(-)